METVVRVALIFIFVTIGLRFLGKRELSELSPHELIMLMLIPEIASQGMIRDDFSLTNSLVGISTLLGLVFLTSFLCYHFPILRRGMEGDPVVLFADGKFRQAAMDRERVSADEILGEARSRGIEGFGDLKWAILEPDGQITCIPQSPGPRVLHKIQRSEI